MNYVIIDLDGTLCDCSQRVHLAQAGKWDDFHSLIADDQPFKDVASFIDLISNLEFVSIIMLTGRNESYRNQTDRWMNKHSIVCDRLIMRPDKNFESDHVLKPRMLCDEVFEGNFEKMKEEVIVVLEDRDKVVEAWRNLGIDCWQVRNGTY